MTTIRGNDELEALFAAGYAERAIENYYAFHGMGAKDAGRAERSGEALTRLRMGLPARTEDERDAYLEWARAAHMRAVDPLPRPDPGTYGNSYLIALGGREAQFQAQMADGGLIPAGTVASPGTPVAQPRMTEALTRLGMGLPPRDDMDCEIYAGWAQADPTARRYHEAARRGQWRGDWEPEFDEYVTLTEMAEARARELGIETGRTELATEPGAGLDGPLADDPPFPGAGRRARVKCADCELNWEGPAQDWDRYLDFRHHLAHQLGLNRRSPSYSITVSRSGASVAADVSSPGAGAPDAAGHPGQDQQLGAGSSAEASQPSAPPVADSLPSGTSQRVRAVCPPCGLDWEGPAQAWDDHFSDRHARDHQKGTGGLSASAPLSVERRTTNEAVTGADASQLETAALTQIARAREQDRTHDHAPEPPI